jgi:hypothetical protein
VNKRSRSFATFEILRAASRRAVRCRLGFGIGHR